MALCCHGSLLSTADTNVTEKTWMDENTENKTRRDIIRMQMRYLKRPVSMLLQNSASYALGVHGMNSLLYERRQTVNHWKATDFDKLNEISASKTDFRLADSIHGHFQSFVHGQRAIGRNKCI